MKLLLSTFGGILGSLSCHREALKAPTEQPIRAQDRQKRAQEDPKSPRRARLHQNLRFIQNRRVSVIKQRFSRLSGSAWEFEICTERLQDEEDRVLGDDGEINQIKFDECVIFQKLSHQERVILGVLDYLEK